MISLCGLEDGNLRLGDDCMVFSSVVVEGRREGRRPYVLRAFFGSEDLCGATKRNGGMKIGERF